MYAYPRADGHPDVIAYGRLDRLSALPRLRRADRVHAVRLVPRAGDQANAVIALAVLTGVALTAWVLTVGAVAYALWRYAYSPFVVVRRDITELATRVAALDRQLQDAVRIKNAQMDDAEVARIERKFQTRAAAQGLR